MTKTKKNFKRKHQPTKTRRSHKSVVLKPDETLSILQFNNIENSIIKPSKQSSEQLRQDFIKSFEIPKSNFTPNNDFYRNVNYNWIEKELQTKEKTRRLQKDNFRILQQTVNYQVYTVVDEYIKKNKGSFWAKTMKSFWSSIQNFNSIQSSLKYAREITNQIDAMRQNKSNLWSFLGIISQNDIIKTYSPIYWIMSANVEDSSKFASHIHPHQLPFYHSYVFNGNQRDPLVKKHMKEKYKFVNRTFTHILGKGNYKKWFNDFVDTERKIYNIFVETQNKVDKPYYKVSKEDAIQKYGFDWDAFARALGYNETPPFFYTGNVEFLKKIVKLLQEEWTSEKWRPYWLLMFYRFIVRYTKDWRDTYFDYFGKFLLGFRGDWYEDIKFQTILLMSYPFQNLMSELYCQKYRNEKAEKFAMTMAEDLKLVFIRVLERNTWLSPRTKSAAIEKIKKLQFFIGHLLDEYAVKKYPDPHIEYSSTELIQNLLDVSHARTQEIIQLEGTKYFDLSNIDWQSFPFQLTGRVSFIVNAFYSLYENSIHVSVGYLQEPFVDMDKYGLEYNLATIGFTIAHELSHALDATGNHYDQNGSRRNWWTPGDYKEYLKKQADVLKQYETFAARDGFKYDANISLSEDLADITGLAICEEYLRDYFQSKQIVDRFQYLKFRIFYNYFAYNLRQYVPRDLVQTLMLVNPHPPDVYRVNVPLTRSEVFRATYNVQKGDGMWWHNTDIIW
jgi:predicted metalloendopeptidase